MNWESVGKRAKLEGPIEHGGKSIKFLIESTYDLLLSPQNLKQWVDGDPS